MRPDQPGVAKSKESPPKASAGPSPRKDEARLARAADLLEAVAAVDRTVAARQERDSRFLSALGAHGWMHFPPRPIIATHAIPTSVSLRAPLGAAARATAGLVHQPLHRVELLLASREDEVGATLSTTKNLVCKTHEVSPPFRHMMRSGIRQPRAVADAPQPDRTPSFKPFQSQLGV
jgi:hypothetical protein